MSINGTLENCMMRAALLALLPLPAIAGDTYDLSPDITVSVAGTMVSDETIYSSDTTTTVLGPLPREADVDAFHRPAQGEFLFSLDAGADLAGVAVDSADVAGWNGMQYSVLFDASAAGVPAGVNVDAVSRSEDRLILSFDTTVHLDGQTYDDDDLVAYTQQGGFDMLLDGSVTAVAAELDVDAAHVRADGRILVSFDTGGELGGQAFGHADVLEYDPVADSWAIAFDAAELPGWGSADLDALSVTSDADSDGVADPVDNCTLIANADQRDSNGDGFGNDCDADLNDDCQINFGDLGVLKESFFATSASLPCPDDTPGSPPPCWNADGDLDGDGLINFVDLGIVKAMFFGEPGPSGLVSACEPAGETRHSPTVSQSD